MQRQVRILKHSSRRGFALITAVFLMILLSTMLLKMLSFSSSDAQQVVNDYLLEQAQLAAYGATEFAMLRISTEDHTAGCTRAISMRYPSTGTKLFDVNITIQYVWNGAGPGGTNCGNTLVTGKTVSVTTAEQDGSAYIDVVVASDPVKTRLTEPIRFHRRTLQKL